MKILLNNKQYEFENKLRVLDLLETKDYSIIACKVNNRIRELSFELHHDSEVEFLHLDDYEAVKIYEASLRYVFAMACSRIYPELNIRFNYHISRSIYCRNVKDDTPFTLQMVKNIEEEMNKIIQADIPLVRTVVTNKEAGEIYEQHNLEDKIRILKYRPEKTVHLYQCDGYLNYMYSYMVPSTGYLTKYKLRLYGPGIIIQYPRAEFGGSIPPFENETTYGQTLKRASNFAKTCKFEKVADINEYVDSNKKVDFINMCEARHNRDLAILGEKIQNHIDSIRLIAIAGPSSSGKTTFSNRLRIELLSRGITPVKISIDDYYIDRDKMVPDKNGKYDLEHINAIDYELFNEHLAALINGEEIDMPIFDFTIGKRVPGRKMKVDPKSPIIIEGIHALNDALTSSIPRDQKFKIYIAPHTQVNLDNHNPISMTQFRLLRRLVRDYQFRSSKAVRTLSMWESVRQGEFRWIYDNQEGVDFVFNSELTYELCVLKKHALPLLLEIDSENPFFVEANNLVKFLKYYQDIEDELVPCNSLLREFIGGSCFQDV